MNEASLTIDQIKERLQIQQPPGTDKQATEEVTITAVHSVDQRVEKQFLEAQASGQVVEVGDDSQSTTTPTTDLPSDQHLKRKASDLSADAAQHETPTQPLKQPKQEQADEGALESDCSGHSSLKTQTGNGRPSSMLTRGRHCMKF